MTEEEWLAAADPRRMILYVAAKASARKQRLFAVASFLRMPEVGGAERERTSEVAEHFADGQAGRKELDDVRSALHPQFGSPSAYLLHPTADVAIRGVFIWATDARGTNNPDERFGRPEEVPFQVSLLREVFGNPFRPVAFDPTWRTSDVMLLATGIYAEKAFDRMPILADALQDAGCTSPDLLDHLRDPRQTHVRGCWALDLVLGKE